MKQADCYKKLNDDSMSYSNDDINIDTVTSDTSKRVYWLSCAVKYLACFYILRN